MIKDVLHASPAIPDLMKKVLIQLTELFLAHDINWVLTGSLAFALRGIPYHPQDIDIQTDETGAKKINDLLSEFCIQPVFARRDSTLVRSWFGSFKIKGIDVEVMGDLQKSDGLGNWDTPPELSAYREFITVYGQSVPVFTLAWEADSYRKMQRPAKAAVLADWGK